MVSLSVAERCSLDRFKRQYFQLQAALDFPSPEHLCQDHVQQALYDELFCEALVRYRPPKRYQLRVLKELMKRIECSIDDWEEHGISDDLFLYLSVLLASPLQSEGVSAQQKSYVTYAMSSLSYEVEPATITLLEARNLVAAGGTTGLRTWEACLHLAACLCSSGCGVSIANKSVLELGTGTGLLSILCAKFLGATHVTASDGADTVVSDLSTNFYLNDLQDDERIDAKELWWGHPLMGGEQPEWNGGRPVDVVLGADVTYDAKSIPALVATIVDVLGLWPHAEIIIAATIRNEDTFDVFLTSCQSNQMTVEDLNFPIPTPEDQQGPFYSNRTPIRISKISRRS